MSTYQPLAEVTTAGFDKAMKEFTREVAEHGWLGRRTKQGHIVARAPDGETTICISRSELRGRSDKNVRADFNRWLKQQPEQPEQTEVSTPAEEAKEPEPHPDHVPHPKQWECAEEGCGRSFATERGLKSHRRKHLLVYENCPLCDQRVTYMGKHLRMVHKATVDNPVASLAGTADPVDALEEVIDEVSQLRAEVEELRAERDEALARLDLLREALNA